MNDLVSTRHAYRVKSAWRRNIEQQEKAYELGLIDHRSQYHFWTAQALIERSTRQLSPRR